MDTKYFLTTNGELYHWGVKGMRWGVRRYQNKDGSLTNAGKKRYADVDNPKNMSDQELRSKINRMNLEKRYVNLSKNQHSSKNHALDIAGKSTSIGSEASKIAKDGYKMMDRDSRNINLTGQGFSVASKTAQGVKKISNIVDDKRAAKQAKTKLESMSDKDLQNMVTRMDLEQQYSNLSRETVSRGRVNTMDVLDVVGGIVSIGASASAMAVSLYALKKNIGGG